MHCVEVSVTARTQHQSFASSVPSIAELRKQNVIINKIILKSKNSFADSDDDGGENASIKEWMALNGLNVQCRHIIAQSEVPFSNSMVEAANKSLKYAGLYLQPIPDFGTLQRYSPISITTTSIKHYWIKAVEVALQKMLDK